MFILKNNDAEFPHFIVGEDNQFGEGYVYMYIYIYIHVYIYMYIYI
jgi:hypothetical protein